MDLLLFFMVIRCNHRYRNFVSNYYFHKELHCGKDNGLHTIIDHYIFQHWQRHAAVCSIISNVDKCALACAPTIMEGAEAYLPCLENILI